jgi:hypothetical protein
MLHVKRHNPSSTDASVEYVEKHFPWARIVKNRRNFGYAEGCNIGARYARGEIIAWNITNIRDTMTEKEKSSENSSELRQVHKGKGAGSLLPEVFENSKTKAISKCRWIKL